MSSDVQQSRAHATPDDDRGYQESDLRRRWHRAPAPLRWVLGILLAAAVWVAVRLVPDLLIDDDSPARVWYSVGLGVLAVVLLVVGVLVGRRRLGGPGQMKLFRKALRSGELPEGADVDHWRRELPRMLRFQRESRWLVRSAFISPVLLLVATVVAALAGAPAGVVVVMGVLTASLVAVGFFSVWLRRRRVRRLTQLCEQLGVADA